MDYLADHKKRMKLRREAIAKREPILLIDVGSSKLAAMVVQYSLPDPARGSQLSFRVLASSVYKSNGIAYGDISDQLKFEHDLRRICDQVQKNSQLKVDHAVVCFSGGRPKSYASIGEVEVADGTVTERDIGHAMSACEYPPLDPGREFLHLMPINFTLDHQTGLTDPRRLVGARLACDMHMLSIDSASVHNMAALIRGVEMDLLGITTSPFMAGFGVLTEDELKRGTIVVDFGAMTTSVAVFYANQLMFAKVIRLGGVHVTNDISHAFDISPEHAEKLKTFHGGVEATAQDDREVIDLAEGAGGYYSERRTITRGQLIGIIRPRFEEIFEHIVDVISEAGLDDLPDKRVVLTGGAAQIAGLDGMAERYVHQRVRIGRPLRLAGASAQQSSPVYAAISGLAMYIGNPKDEFWDFVDSGEPRSALNLRAIAQWFKENW